MAILSAILGGVTGVVGSVAKGYTDLKKAKIEAETAAAKAVHDQVMLKEENRMMELELKSHELIVSTEAKAKTDMAAEESFRTGLALEDKRYSEGMRAKGFWRGAMFALDFIRGVVRPGLTLYLCVMTTVIAVWAYRVAGDIGLTQAQAAAMLSVVVETVLYLTTACVTFWFGTRNKQKPPKVS